MMVSRGWFPFLRSLESAEPCLLVVQHNTEHNTNWKFGYEDSADVSAAD